MRQRTIGLVSAAALLLAFACTTAIDEAASKPAPDSGEGNQVDSRPPAVSRPAESPVADEGREAASKPAPDLGEGSQVGSGPTAVSRPAQSPISGEGPATATKLDPVFATQLTDVRTGESYSMAKINEEKVIVLDLMAVWCVVCRAQAVELKRAVASWGDQVEVIMLDVDPSEDADTLKAYGEQQKYAWKLSLSPREISLKLRDQFGPTVLNNTLAPLIVIDRQGELHRLRNGVKPVDEILAEVGNLMSRSE